jgi:hypothetical protein
MKLLSARTYHWHRHLGARLLPPVQERQAGRASAEILVSALADIRSHQYLNAIWNVINLEEAEKWLAEATSPICKVARTHEQCKSAK